MVQQAGLAHVDIRTPTRQIRNRHLSWMHKAIGSLLDGDTCDPDAFAISRLLLATREAGQRCSDSERLWIYIAITQILPRFTWKAYVDALCGTEAASALNTARQAFLEAFLATTPCWTRTISLLLNPASFSRTLALTCATSAILSNKSPRDNYFAQISLGGCFSRSVPTETDHP